MLLWVKSRPSTPQAKAKEAGFEVVDAAEATKRGDLIAVLIPDHVQPKVYKEQIEPNLGKGKTLLFAHGFNIHFKFVVPPSDGGRHHDRAQVPRSPPA